MDLQQVLDVPAFFIHHPLQPTNSLVRHSNRLIPEALQLTINSKAGHSRLLLFRFSFSGELSKVLDLFSCSMQQKMENWRNCGYTGSLKSKQAFRNDILNNITHIKMNAAKLKMH